MSDRPSDQHRKALVGMCGDVRVTVARSDENVILTIGTFSMTLSRAAAGELSCFLAEALDPDGALEGLPVRRN